MSIYTSFAIILGIIVTSSVISVYSTASLDIKSDDVKGQIEGNETAGVTKDRGVFARCLESLWDAIMGGAGSMVEDKIISGNPDNVGFYLYPDPHNSDFVQEIVYEDLNSLHNARVRFDQPWKFVIHGFTEQHISKPGQQIKNAYHTKMRQLQADNGGSSNAPSYNVVVVDWGKLADPKFSGDAQNLFYTFAVGNVPLVGKRVGDFVYFLMKNKAVQDLDKVHIIGFSLGAHVSGNAGNTLKLLTNQLPNRITGLDPAGPSFYQGLSVYSRQLSNEDAKFVDIIHTNQGALGIFKNIGHADFYPNGGGPIQKPCLTEFQKQMDGSGVVNLNVCSHSKAPFFFSLSINRYLPACKCNSLMEYKRSCACSEKALFGEYCDHRSRGSFYLELDE